MRILVLFLFAGLKLAECEEKIRINDMIYLRAKRRAGGGAQNVEVATVLTNVKAK